MINIDAEIIATLMTILATVFGYIIKRQHDRLTEVKNQLSDKKYNLYHQIYSAFFDLVHNYSIATKIANLSKREKEIENVTSALTQNLLIIKKDIFIYAPDVVLTKFLAWTNLVTDNPKDQSHALLYLQLCVEIRKDMGHPKTEIKEDAILRAIMSSSSEFQEMWKLLKKEKG